MLFFYLLVSVMPMMRHPLWAGLLGDFTLIKYVGLICLVYALLYLPARVSSPRFLATWQARWFLLLAVLGMASFVFMGPPIPWEISPFLSFASFLLFFFVTLVVVDSLDRLRWTLLVAIGSVAYASLHTLREWQKYGGMSLDYRPGWVTGDPNYFSVSALLCVPLAFYLLRTRQAPWERWFCMGTLALTLPALFLAGSRGALLGLTAAFLWVALHSRRRGRMLVLGSALLLPALYFAPSSPLNRILIPTQFDQYSIDSRMAHWDVGLNMLQERWLTGIGAGNFKPLVTHFGLEGFEPTIAHNTFIEVAAEMGLPGIFLFLATIVATFVTLERVRRRTCASGPALLYHAAEGIEAGLIAYLPTAFFLSAQYQKLLWLLIFLSMVLPILLRQSTASAALAAGSPPQARLTSRLPQSA